jgi:hypothetical protein
MTTTDRDRAHVLWREADDLRKKARWLRDDAERIEETARRMDTLAAAIADGRAQDELNAAMEMGGRA